MLIFKISQATNKLKNRLTREQTNRQKGHPSPHCMKPTTRGSINKQLLCRNSSDLITAVIQDFCEISKIITPLT